MPHTRILTAFGLLTATMGALAAEVQTGAVNLYEVRPYRDVGGENRVFPLLFIHHGSFYFEGIELGYNLHEGDTTSIKLLATPTMQGYSSGDSRYLQGMSARKYDIAAGAEVSYRIGMERISLQVLHDVAAVYDGIGAKLEFSHLYMAAAHTVLEPYAGLEYLGAAKADYYYGVTADEARAGRPAYRLQGATNRYLGINAIHNLDDRWSLVGNIEQRYLDADIAASPIVEHSQSLFAYLGVLYQW